MWALDPAYHVYENVRAVTDQISRLIDTYRNNRPEVFLGKVVLKICSEYTGEHPWRSTISIKLLCNFIEITLRQGYSPVNLLHIFTTPFLQKTTGRLLLHMQYKSAIARPSWFKSIRSWMRDWQTRVISLDLLFHHLQYFL